MTLSAFFNSLFPIPTIAFFQLYFPATQGMTDMGEASPANPAFAVHPPLSTTVGCLSSLSAMTIAAAAELVIHAATKANALPLQVVLLAQRCCSFFFQHAKDESNASTLMMYTRIKILQNTCGWVDGGVGGGVEVEESGFEG
jgi:hypothetical protein